MPKALPLTGLSQKAHTLSPIFSLQPQQSKWPEMHCAILVLGDISSKQVGHRGFGMLLFLLLLSSIFIFSFSVEASRLASGLGDSLGLLSPCLNRHLLARRPPLRLHRDHGANIYKCHPSLVHFLSEYDCFCFCFPPI